MCAVDPIIEDLRVLQKKYDELLKWKEAWTDYFFEFRNKYCVQDLMENKALLNDMITELDIQIAALLGE